MNLKPAALACPRLRIEADGGVISETFDDVYFSREGGAAETEHVFLRGNDLPARWQQRAQFHIAETGFGTGLNFIVTAEYFLRTTPSHHRLHYVSFEHSPLKKDQLCAVHAKNPMADALIRHYPLRIPGLHRIELDRITLTLAFGDAHDLLAEIPDGYVHAWFLDGFAPAKNPDLWDAEIFTHIARASADDARCATYTAAAAVRRGLESVGFCMEKRQGFGKKRDMLAGHNQVASRHRARSVPHDLVIVGAGIAGAALANSFARHECAVTVLEAHEAACGASGNPAAALYPQITKHWGRAAQWHMAAYSYTIQWLARRSGEGLQCDYTATGMAKLAMDTKEEEKCLAFTEQLGLDPAIARWMDAPALSAQIGAHVAHGGLWFADAGWVNPAALCRGLLAHPRINLRERCILSALHKTSDGWQLILNSGEIVSARVVILANAYDAMRLIPSLKLTRTAGQISVIERAGCPLTAVLSHSGYAIPHDDQLILGATYDRADFSCAVTQKNHDQTIAEFAAALALPVSPRIIAGRSSIRAATPQRLPYVGATDDGLYVSGGFGSRGMISAPFAAAIIRSEVLGEMPPAARALREAMQPPRHYTVSACNEENPSRANTAS